MSKKWKHAIVIGASGGIGEALVYELARQGVSVALVARRTEELERVAAEASRLAALTDGSRKAAFFQFVHDVTHFSEVPSLFQEITRQLGGLDLIIYNSGIMPAIARDEYNFEKDKTILETNLLGAFAWLNEAAMRFQNAGEGTIVGISSIAGERGRRGMPAYMTSKAAISTYLESLRNRLSQYGVKVVTIKPGVIDTPMSKNAPNKLWLYSPEDAAKEIISAARRGVTVKYVPWKWRIVSFVLHSLPSFIFRRLNF
ncbi:MAG: SDR family NAD(P)-dependent oxidoreductase [Ignavibacteriota bacterium]